MKLIINERGYFTIESAILLPSILFLVCLFIGFFCICLKVGAFQALTNHERLVAQLGTQRSYKIEQMEDSRTQLTVNKNKRSQYDDLVRSRQAYKVEMTAPFYKDSVVVEAYTDEWTLPFIYQLSIAKNLGNGLEQLRQKLGGKP